MNLNVTIPDTFDGPLGLLHYLIKRDEIDIFDIPISKLASSYLEEMRKIKLLDMDEAAKFIDLASRLLEIKSRLLLPPEERQEDEEEEEDLDPRSGLVAALLEYRRFKDAARLLGELAEEQDRRYPRPAPPPELSPAGRGDDPSVNSLALLQAFQNLLLRLPSPDRSVYIKYGENAEVPIAVRVQQIEKVLAEAGRARFSLLLSSSPEKREMVGFFIAMLELIRQGRIVARQSGNYSDIVLEPRSASAAPAEPKLRKPRRPSAPRCFMLPGGSPNSGGKTKFQLPPANTFPPPMSRRPVNRHGTPRRKTFAAVFSLCFRHPAVHPAKCRKTD